MRDTWNYDLMELLRQAHRGSPTGLREFVTRFAPLAATNDDYSVLLTLRQFEAAGWEDNRRVLNCAPQNQSFQWGITVTQASAGGGSQCNVYLPNEPTCTGLRLRGQEVELLLPTGNRQTNVTELLRKLPNYGRLTEEFIADAFARLRNEQYEARQPTRPPVAQQVIELPSFGSLTYQAQYNSYVGNFLLGPAEVMVTLTYTDLTQLASLLAYADAQLRAAFYTQLLAQAEAELLALKNDDWLGEDEETGEEEEPVTPEELRERLLLDSIAFYDDRSASVYYEDDDLFAGHYVELRASPEGQYAGVTLAG